MLKYCINAELFGSMSADSAESSDSKRKAECAAKDPPKMKHVKKPLTFEEKLALECSVPESGRQTRSATGTTDPSKCVV